jgi:hypothetical protein
VKRAETGRKPQENPAGAEAHPLYFAFAARLKPCPFKKASFSAACLATAILQITEKIDAGAKAQHFF